MDKSKPNKAKPSSEFQTIAPATLSLGPTPAESGEAPAPTPWFVQYRGYLLALFLLIALLLAVVFVLPRMVPTPDAPASSSPAPVAAAPPLESPWNEAQIAKQRLAAQEILAELLKRQSSLEQKQVTVWDEPGYQAAMALAAEGDELYRQREFAPAQDKYHATLVAFDTLLEKSAAVFDEAIDRGARALADEQAEPAITAYQLALDINNDSSDAQQGLRRAEVLDEVLSLLAEGTALERRQQLEEARERYQQAKALDGQSEKVTRALASNSAAITDRDFSKAMSLGYAALQQGAFDNATRSFRHAERLKPGSSLAKDALVQTDNQRSQTRINDFLAKGQAEEQQEAWQAASDWYQKALAIDDSVVTARIGQIRADARHKLDQQLTAAIAKPERLMNQAVYGRTRQLYRDAVAMTDGGPKHQRQVAALGQMLKDALLDVQVELQSDNLTQVTLYKVGKLGQFTTKQLALKPGRYTVVGTRDGYRDVRREFTVKARERAPAIVIQCRDKVKNG